jgi:SAM-dependent methyltransferase
MTDYHAGEIPSWLRARAEAYARAPLVRRPLLRARFVRFSGVRATDSVLDVGTGPGFSAFALARRAKQVTAVDWRPELLLAARREALRRKITSVTFLEAQPDDLPFPDNSFDVVASAAALHHFVRPRSAIQDMARTCRPGGTVVLEDVVTSEQDVRARYHNRLERLRDRSHERLLKLSEVVSLAGQIGLFVRRVEVHDSVREFSEWVGVTRPPLRRTEQLRHLLQGAVEHDLTGLEVEGVDDTFFFVQKVAWVLCTKPA